MSTDAIYAEVDERWRLKYVVVEWSSPDVGHVVDFPIDRFWFYHLLPVCCAPFL